MELDPAALSPRERYRLMIGAIVPRPIAVVSTRSPLGAVNLAPFSFFTGVGIHPMTLLFCPANAPDGSDKDTLRNALPVTEGGSGEFVVNVATEQNIRRVVAAAEALPYGQSEFEVVGLTPVPALKVAPPRALESPLAFECRTVQVIRTNPGQAGGGNLVLGEVVHMHVDERVLENGLLLAPERLAAVGRMGGMEYVRCRDRFTLPPGLGALDAPGV